MEILKDEEPEGHLPVCVARLALVGQHLEHDGGRAERDEEPRKERRAPAHPEGREQPRGHQRGESHLEAPAAEYQPFYPCQPPEAELDADGEEEQDHAHLGCGVHQLQVTHQPECVRADQHAGEQEADDGDEPQALADVGDERPGGD
jgi:hypothetical protein